MMWSILSNLMQIGKSSSRQATPFIATWMTLVTHILFINTESS